MGCPQQGRIVGVIGVNAAPPQGEGASAAPQRSSSRKIGKRLSPSVINAVNPPRPKIISVEPAGQRSGDNGFVLLAKHHPHLLPLRASLFHHGLRRAARVGALVRIKICPRPSPACRLWIDARHPRMGRDVRESPGAHSKLSKPRLTNTSCA